MNRSLRFFAFLASLVLGDAFKIQKPFAVSPLADWDKVTTYLNEMNYLVFMSGFLVLQDAYGDNADVGDSISAKMGVGWDESIKLLGIVETEITERTLTVEIAKIHLGELLVLITDVYRDITPDILQLHPIVQSSINGHFSTLFLNIPQIAEQIYTALEEPTPPSCGLFAISPNDTVTPNTPVDIWTPPGTEFWSERIFNVESSFLLVNAHNKYLESEIADARLVLETSVDFPNFVTETGLRKIQRTIMFQCFDGSMTTYKFEIDVNTDPIVEPTVKPMF